MSVESESQLEREEKIGFGDLSTLQIGIVATTIITIT